MSMLIFIITFTLFLLGLFFAKSRIVSLLFLIYFWVLMGLNTNTPDYSSYAIHFYNPELGFEFGFQMLILAMNRVGFTYEQFRMGFAAIYSITAVATSRRLSRYSNFILAMFLLWPFIPFVSGLRIALGTMIVCFSIPYLADVKKHGTIKYIVGVIIASSIHASCLFYLVFIFAKKRYRLKDYLYVFLGCFALVFAIRTNFLGELAGISGNPKLIKWLTYSGESSVGALNLLGFISNSSFVIAFAFFVNKATRAFLKPNMLYDVNKVDGDEYEARRMSLFGNISFIMLLTIPGYALTSEFQRFLFGILPVYYAVFGEYKYLIYRVPVFDKKVLQFVFFIAVIMLAAFYIYSTRSHDVFATFTNNVLFD